MNTIVILPQNVPQKDILINSLVVPHYDFDTLDKTQLTNIQRVGFIWDNNNCKAPFGKTSYTYVKDLTDVDATLHYFSLEFVNLVKYLYEQNNSIIIDLITCSFNTPIAQNDINYLKEIMPNITINYSTNNTGNSLNNPNTDWIMESNGENIQQIYFNQNIVNFTDDLSADSLVNLGFAISSGSTYSLNNPLTLTVVNNATTIGGNTITFPIDISLLATTIDGANYQIIINSNVAFNGLFNGAKSGGTTFKNFNIILNGNVGYSTLWMNNVIGNLNISVLSSYAIINGNISGGRAGGLVGYFAGLSSNASIMSSYVIINGDVSGVGAGGLIGSDAGKSGSCAINSSYAIINGNVSGLGSGGLIGWATRYLGSCSITSSYVVICGTIDSSYTYAIAGFYSNDPISDDHITGTNVYAWVLNNGTITSGLKQSHSSLSDTTAHPVYYNQTSVPITITNLSGMTNAFHLNYRVNGTTIYDFLLPSVITGTSLLYNIGSLSNNCAFYPHAILSNKNLSNVNISNSDLNDATLTNATLTGANLTGANLSGANLTGTIPSATNDLTNTYTLSLLSNSITYGDSITFTLSNQGTNVLYQLYQSTTNSYNGTAVSGAIAYSSTLNTLSAGNYYYYYKITYSGTGEYKGSFIYSQISPLTVNRAILTIIANNDSKIYGNIRTYGSGLTAFTSIGLKNGETIGSVTITDTNNGGIKTALVGTYDLTPSLAIGGTFNVANYSVTYIAGTLFVTQPNTQKLTSLNVSLILSLTTKVNIYGLNPGLEYGKYKFYSSDSDVVEIDLGGNIKGKKVGKFYIIVTDMSGLIIYTTPYYIDVI